ncbi:hypothetical protein BEWA_039000 [Theileria equi strain WA]|uniref:Uncharacterized protein n=1 Tax=Theileria equi strain WA TaxID=1537102 RepID=L1LEK7_THEEQ|nr:hypothetical protein BEWA_039000 [Theileria equi strain WA]EKX73862.1 hypothetical protein BEWA_039000 [Theileria equi strain WA]|eukprot:XP_004833314.1 hypothetical protein BEWA_039000 [Theileria equi strain WA]
MEVFRPSDVVNLEIPQHLGAVDRNFKRSSALNLWNIAVNILPSYAFLLLLFIVRHVSFRGHHTRSLHITLCLILSCLATLMAIVTTANAISRLQVTDFGFLFVFVGGSLYYAKLYHQRADFCKILDKQDVSSYSLMPFFARAFIHSLLSLLVSIAISIVHQTLDVLLGSLANIQGQPYYTTFSSFTWHVNYVLSQIPNSASSSSHWLFQIAKLLPAMTWVIALSEYYIDVMNLESTHMDALIVATIEEFPAHNMSTLDNEILFSRAMYNYSKGISHVLDQNKNKYILSPPSLNVPEDDSNRRRSPMQPFTQIATKSKYLESKKVRYQVNDVVYRMLVASPSKLFTSYVDACIETMNETRVNLHRLMFSSFSTHEHKLGHAFKTREHLHGYHNHRLHNAIQTLVFYLTPSARSHSTHVLNVMLLCIIYLRGITSWLCAANMLGYDRDNVKEVSRDVVFQVLGIHKTISTLNRASIPLYVQNYIDTLNAEINYTLKSLSVFTESLLYSKYNTNFDTYRVLEHLYSGNKGAL